MRARLVFAAIMLTSGLAAAQQIDPQREYAACMAEARTKPATGWDRATRWAGLGGGDAARHCQAVALIGMGQPGEAARRIEALAQDVRAGAGFRAELLAQAGQAYLLAGNPTQADVVLSAAIKLDPEDLELRLDRGQVRAQRGDFAGAVQDLSAVLAKDPRKVDALVFRASAFRLSGDRERASTDLVAALSLNPTHPEALLERGMLNRLNGNTAAARRDWLGVIQVAPGTPAAQLAQENIQLMDSGGQTKGKGK
jgi:regulator of sirC expression with transglutaminase-like and TPR domain